MELAILETSTMDIASWIASLINHYAWLIGLLGVALITIPSSIILILQSLFYLKGRNRIFRYGSRELDCLLSIIVPVRKEPIELINACLRYICSSPFRDRIEVILVSDDPPQVLETLKSTVSKWRKKGLNLHLVWRSEAKGFRTGALNVGLLLSRGKYIYVMDVDSRVPWSFFGKALWLMERGYKAVVGRWRGLNSDSRLAEAISYSMDYIVDSIYRGRASLGLPVMPVGTGTLYNREYLVTVLGGWDEERIQDDMEIGARIIYSGGRIGFIDSTDIGVEVPRTLRSFRIQQERWSYGATDAALSRLKHILGSRQPLYARIEMLLFLLQYVPVLLTLLGIVFVVLSSAFGGIDPFKDFWFLGLPWIASMILYGACYIDSHRRRGRDAKRALVNLGRITAATTVLTLTLSKAVLKALARRPFIYKRTPKGVFEKKRSRLRFPWEVVFSILLTLYSIYGLANGIIYTAGWIIFYNLGYYYSFVRWTRDFFFK